MDEARRFLRYVLPGIVFAIVFLIILLMLRPDYVSGVVLEELKKESGIVLILAGILASGGLGVIFSEIHHFLHWQFEKRLDHSELIKRFIYNNHLTLVDDFGSVNLHPKLSQECCWIIATALFRERQRGENFMAIAESKLLSLVDLVHSTGTNRVAAGFGVIIGFLTAACISEFSTTAGCVRRFMFALVLGILWVWVIHFNHCRLARLTKGVIEEVMGDAIRKEAKRDWAWGGIKAVETWQILPKNKKTNRLRMWLGECEWEKRKDQVSNVQTQ